MTSASSAPGDALRVSDADRERVADALRRHHLEGRLDTDELQERLERCYAARTAGDLAPLLADLPVDEPVGRRRTAGAGPSGAVVAGVALLVLALLTAAAVAHGHPGPLPLLAVFLLFRLARGPRRHPTAWGSRG
jgi:hypothetical protein